MGFPVVGNLVDWDEFTELCGVSLEHENILSRFLHVNK